ncbi:MAG: cation:proton antiporter [Candidatus Omnitrophica bacterium]|nr:cation:proton antiporter [Candidatus Omnitrophota bacterium]
MMERIFQIFSDISFFHINMLFILGLALFGGTVGGRIFQKMKIPQVVGYIVIGVILGRSGFNIIDAVSMKTLQPFSYFALGLIGFMIGGELSAKVIAKYGKKFVAILLFEGLASFAFVAIAVGVAGTYLTKDASFSWSLGLLLGAIASATDAASTTDVLWEYRTRGPLTTTVFGIVALDDALALLLFAVTASITTKIIGASEESVVLAILHPLYEIGGAIFVGLVSGSILVNLLKKYEDRERVLAFLIGTVLFVLGLSLAINVSMLLAAMVLGAVVVNGVPQISKRVFKLVEEIAPPIFILFFVFVGAKLDFGHITPFAIALIVIYLIGRTAGKMLGAFVGARTSKSSTAVQKYLPFCLFSQAGVAIGLSIVAAHILPPEMGNIVVIVITTTTFFVQMIGPPCVKYAIEKAGEVGLNITEEDLIDETRISELLDTDFPLIKENATLDEILDIFCNHLYSYYPVVDKDKRLKGVVGVESMRQAFMYKDLGNFVIAADIMEFTSFQVSSEASAMEAKKIFDGYHLDFLPVTNKDGDVVGCVEERIFYQLISRKMIEAERKAGLLE